MKIAGVGVPAQALLRGTTQQEFDTILIVL